jgi:dolichol-phosphate mannosyltransferase
LVTSILNSTGEQKENVTGRSLKLQERFSIIIPTYNEAGNIIPLLEKIRHNIPKDTFVEVVIVDDDSPDGTGQIVDDYMNHYDGKYSGSTNNDNRSNQLNLKVVHRKKSKGLISAILDGVKHSQGDIIVVMDADLSHPPELIPRIIDEFRGNPNGIVIASRYIGGGTIRGWSLRRRIISWGAVTLARYGLRIRSIRDPMSGYFAVPRKIMDDISFGTRGYKMLLEILVKEQTNTKRKEIPYSFQDRRLGKSKLGTKVIIEYVLAIWQLYRYGQKKRKVIDTEQKRNEERKSVLFLSKAGRFFTVGASGLVINYLASLLISNYSTLWYMHATLGGIAVSMTSNFLLNRIWTFEDTDFSSSTRILKQYLLFLAFSSIGASIQLILVYLLVEFGGYGYAPSLILAVLAGSGSNFILNKKWTFKERIWG